MGSICRLCLHKNDLDVMMNVFEFCPKYFELNLTEILYWIFDVEIIVEDSYSKLICYKCLKVIESIGRFRKFFQLNQTFLHERRCPEDYEVQSGWYNTRDIGTSTEILEDPNFVKISINDINSLRKTQVNIQKRKSTTENVKKANEITPLKQNENTQHNDKETQADGIKLVNVSVSTLEEFLKIKTINKALERIDVPRTLFEYFSPNVNLPEFTKECSKQGYAKMGITYSRFHANNLYIPLKKVDSNRMLFRHYRKIEKMTYKLIPKLRKKEQIRLQKKKQLIQDYYYRKPTSALRELITETNSEADSQQTDNIISLVETDEVSDPVCGYCNRVFKFNKNRDQHVDRFHKNIMPTKVENNLQNKLTRKINSSRKSLDRVPNKFVKDSTTAGRGNAMNISSASFVEIISNKLDNILKTDNNKEQENNSDVEVEIDVPDIINIESEIMHDNFNDIEEDLLEIESENVDSQSGSKSWVRVKDIKQLQTDEIASVDVANGDFSIDFLKTVIFGENLETNATITYHYDDHNYATVVEPELSKKLPSIIRRGRKAKVAPAIVNIIEKRFEDIKETREKIEKMKKLRFALHNEINNCYIKSFLTTIQDKLRVIREVT